MKPTLRRGETAARSDLFRATMSRKNPRIQIHNITAATGEQKVISRWARENPICKSARERGQRTFYKEPGICIYLNAGIDKTRRGEVQLSQLEPRARPA